MLIFAYLVGAVAVFAIGLAGTSFWPYHGAGRTGSLLGPLMGGALVSQGMSPSQLFQISSIAPLLACASLLIFMKFSSSASTTRSATVDVTP